MWKEMKESEEYLQYLAPVDFELCLKCCEPTEELLIIKTCGHTFCGACFDDNRILEVEDDDEVRTCLNDLHKLKILNWYRYWLVPSVESRSKRTKSEIMTAQGPRLQRNQRNPRRKA
jgi:hypothetical protein